MITNKDIRVENGSLIINGDPYPLDGQSPEAIMKIVEDNSDTTPTENSDAPITSGGVYNTIGDLTQTGVTGASVSAQLGSVHSLISMINDLPPAATTTPADIPTGIRIHFNIGSQTVGYPLGNALYISIKIAESRCVQILFENGATTPEGKYRTVLNSTTWSDWKSF